MGKFFMFLSDRGAFRFLLKLSARVSAYLTAWMMISMFAGSALAVAAGSGLAPLALVAVVVVSFLLILLAALCLEFLLDIRKNTDRLADEVTELRIRQGQG